MADFNTVLQATPNDFWSLSRRGDVYRQQNNLQAALGDLNAALDLSPNYIEGLKVRSLGVFD